jgi:membrane glycosyltransferase
LAASDGFRCSRQSLHYTLAPLLFALLPLAAVNAATSGGAGTPRGGLLRGMGEELVLSLLLDPIGALDRSVTVARLALGHRGGWTPQPRTGRGIPWPASLRRFGAHTVVGGALLAAFATTGWFPALVALPFLLGLLLAVPLCVITGRPDRAS